MTVRNVEHLRKHLFDALEGLADKKQPLDLDRARAISDVAQTIINSAKVEVDFLRATSATHSRFLGSEEAEAAEEGEPRPSHITSTLQDAGKPQAGIVGIRQHRIAG